MRYFKCNQQPFNNGKAMAGAGVEDLMELIRSELTLGWVEMDELDMGLGDVIGGEGKRDLRVLRMET